MSDQSKGGWEGAKRETGVNVTALMEALGLLLARGEWKIPPEAVELAREIAADRDAR